jgi:hypothetical protein
MADGVVGTGATALLVLQVKNMGHYFAFEAEVRDDRGEHRRFRANNYQARIPPTALGSSWARPMDGGRPHADTIAADDDARARLHLHDAAQARTRVEPGAAEPGRPHAVRPRPPSTPRC